MALWTCNGRANQQWRMNVGVRAYDIYRDDAKVGAVTTSAPATAFVDSALAASNAYQYYVVARDAQANVSPHSNAATVTTGAACGSSVCPVTQIATDTDIPWGLVTLPDGTILYNRRDAHDIVHLNPATGAKTSVGTVPNVDNTDGEGGLLGLAISSSYASDHNGGRLRFGPDGKAASPTCRSTSMAPTAGCAPSSRPPTAASG